MEVILVQGVNKKIMSQTYAITQNFQNQIEKNTVFNLIGQNATI